MQKNNHDLILQENQELRAQLAEAQEALEAIRNGEVDALVIYGQDGEQIYTLQGADHAYRIMVESISEGAATLDAEGTFIYCNHRMADMLGVPLETLPGSSLFRFISPTDYDTVSRLLEEGARRLAGRAEIELQMDRGTALPVLLSVSASSEESGLGICLIATDLTVQKRNEEIVAAERLARSILEQAGEAIVVCDTQGTIIRSNQYACQIASCNPLFHPFDQVFPIQPVDDRSDLDLFTVQSVLQGNQFRGVQARLEGANGMPPIFLLVNATPLRNDLGANTGCVITLTDLTERKQAELALEKANNQLRLILESITDSYIELDSDWRIQEINPAAQNTFFRGQPAGELLGRVFWDLYPQAVEGDIYQHFSKAVLDYQPVHLETYSLISERWLEIHAYPRGGRLHVYSRDITDRKRVEEETIHTRAEAELQHRLIDQREQERQQIARDLHDGPVQDLTGVALALQLMVQDAQSLGEAEELIIMRETIEKQIRDLRIYAGQLRPPSLFKFGLENAIRNHLDDFRKRHPQLNVHSQIGKTGMQVPETIRLALYRIYQEALTNIIKHSGATDTWIQLKKQPKSIELTIRDNGRGFTPPNDWLDLARHGHLGLVGMRERVEAIGGRLNIQSTLDQGTEIRVKVALEADLEPPPETQGGSESP